MQQRRKPNQRCISVDRGAGWEFHWYAAGIELSKDHQTEPLSMHHTSGWGEGRSYMKCEVEFNRTKHDLLTNSWMEWGLCNLLL